MFAAASPKVCLGMYTIELLFCGIPSTYCAQIPYKNTAVPMYEVPEEEKKMGSGVKVLAGVVQLATASVACREKYSQDSTTMWTTRTACTCA